MHNQIPPRRLPPSPAMEASKPVQACDHQYHYFGDQQKRRRCNRCNELESVQAEALHTVLDRFEAKERGIPQAHIAAQLVAELRAALATQQEAPTSRKDVTILHNGDGEPIGLTGKSELMDWLYSLPHETVVRMEAFEGPAATQQEAQPQVKLGDPSPDDLWAFYAENAGLEVKHSWGTAVALLDAAIKKYSHTLPIEAVNSAVQTKPLTPAQRRALIDQAGDITDGLNQDDFADEIVNLVEAHYGISATQQEAQPRQLCMMAAAILDQPNGTMDNRHPYWPQAVEQAKRAFAALATQQEAQPQAERKAIATWQERIQAAHPKSDPEHWPSDLKAGYMAHEIADLRAALATQQEAPTASNADRLKAQARWCANNPDHPNSSDAWEIFDSMVEALSEPGMKGVTVRHSIPEEAAALLRANGDEANANRIENHFNLTPGTKA